MAECQMKNVPNRMRAGDFESLSQLMALAATKPTFSTRAQNPLRDHPERLLQADEKRPIATRSQYAAQSETVPYNMSLARPYTEPEARGLRGVVAMFTQSSSLL